MAPEGRERDKISLETGCKVEYSYMQMRVLMMDGMSLGSAGWNARARRRHGITWQS
jgi:hypothetical protein